jgi:beta-1,4-mannosyl-glycoprotein beta-1,4-N-acetylglucosaminyltransferase
MKTYNIFTFFDEVELLKFRIEYLQDVIDYFVIVEADQTFSGLPKQQNFSFDLFPTELRKKIRYYYISYPENINFPVTITERSNPNNKKAWAREWYSRSRLSDGLFDAEPEDFIILSDVDEVPYKEVFQIQNKEYLSQQLDIHKVIDLTQYVFHYNLDGFLLNPDETVHVCNATKLVKFKDFTTAYELRGISKFHLGPCGCHFSYFGGVDKIKNKIKSFSHTELATDSILNSIDSCVKENKQFYHNLVMTNNYPKSIVPELVFTKKYIDFFAGNDT